MFMLKKLKDINQIHNKQLDKAKINELSKLIDKMRTDLDTLSENNNERLNYLKKRYAELDLLEKKDSLTPEEIHRKKQIQISCDLVKNHPAYTDFEKNYNEAKAELLLLEQKLAEMQQIFSEKYDRNQNDPSGDGDDPGPGGSTSQCVK